MSKWSHLIPFNSSAIADHMTQTDRRIKWDHFDILATGHSDIHCKIKETLLIRDLKPALNKMLAAFHCHYFPYSTLNKITQFWLVESSTINLKLYSVGVPIKVSWKRRNFVECTINTKSRDLLIQLVNNRYSWFWKFSNCTRLILRTFRKNFKKVLISTVGVKPARKFKVSTKNLPITSLLPTNKCM